MFKRILLLFAFALPAHARSWTDRLGRTFEAELVRLDGTNVILKLASGREFSLPLADLNQQDQKSLATKNVAKPAIVVSSNFTASWPREIRPEGAVVCKVVKEDPVAGLFIYESPNYRFTCDARVTEDALRNFSVMFETTRKFAKAVPLGLAGREREGKLDIRLFRSLIGYYRSGGPPGSGGCFMPRSGVVLVPMDSLGLREGGTGFSLASYGDNTVLIHELTHQLTPDIYMQDGVSGWFGEGLAEYMAQSPYTWGCFRPDPYGNAVKAYVTGEHGRDLGIRLEAPKLKDFMLMSYRAYSGGNGNFNYGFGLLLVHYFIHIEGGGQSTRLIQFLKGLQAGATGQAALAPLLGGGSFEKLEAEISSAWGRLGVEIKFGG